MSVRRVFHGVVHGFLLVVLLWLAAGCDTPAEPVAGPLEWTDALHQQAENDRRGGLTFCEAHAHLPAC